MSHTTGTAIPLVDMLLIKPSLWARVGAGTPAHAGQIPGMTPPRGVRRFRSHNAHRVTDANPASQPQASRDEDLQAIHPVGGRPQ